MESAETKKRHPMSVIKEEKEESAFKNNVRNQRSISKSNVSEN